MTDQELEHGWKKHKYYMKVGKFPKVRYFYSAQEYINYVNNLHGYNESKADRPTGRKRNIKGQGKHVEKRGSLIGEATGRKRNPKHWAKHVKKGGTSNSTTDADISETTGRKRNPKGTAKDIGRSLTERKLDRELPDAVGLKDYVFGGSYGKDYRSSKKNLKKITKELARQQKQAEKIQRKIEKLNTVDRPSSAQKRKLKQLQDQQKELTSSIDSFTSQYKKVSEDYLNALYKYEATTLVGQVRKSSRAGKQKAQVLIKKYKDKTIGRIRIKTKKK